MSEDQAMEIKKLKAEIERLKQQLRVNRQLKEMYRKLAHEHAYPDES
tara:strand:- start:14384 stop:14524 length:141 start_codon:yes stop_codon:yes gene_type:complete